MLHTRHGNGLDLRTDGPTLEALEPRVLMSVSGLDGFDSVRMRFGRIENIGPAAITAPDPSNTSDFNDDGQNDLVFRAAAFGQNAYLALDEGAGAGAVALPGLRDANWDLVGVADFDGDDDPDLLFRNSSTKRLTIWRMEGTTRVGTTVLPTAAAFDVAGVADFTTDGTADVALINPATGRLVIWELDLGIIAPSGVFTVDQRIGNRNWQASGAGDLDADGDADLLFRNTTTGQNVIWEMNDTMFVQSSFAPRLVSQTWQVGEVKDFDGDGDADIAWRNSLSNQNAIWLLDNDGATLESSTIIPGFANRQWAMPYGDVVQITPAATTHRSAAFAMSADEGEEVADALLGVEPLVAFAAV